MNNTTATLFLLVESTNSTTHSFVLMNWLEIAVYSMNLLLSFPIHCYIIWLIVTGSAITSEFLNLNLCVCEIGICINSLVFILSFWFPNLVDLELFLEGFSFTGRPLFQCLICVKHYLAVVHPVIFLKYKPLRYRVICCTPIWMITLSFCVVSLHNLSLKLYIEHAWFSSVELSLILFFQLFCLVAVLRALKRTGPGDRKTEENGMKRRAFHLVLITTVSMIVLYLPYAITSISIVLRVQSSVTIWFTGLVCFNLAGFVHPLLYLNCAGKLSCICCK